MGVNDHDTFTGLTPLHKAAADGRLEDVIALMDDGADVDIQANGEVGRGEMRTTRAREGEREREIFRIDRAMRAIASRTGECASTRAFARRGRGRWGWATPNPRTRMTRAKNERLTTKGDCGMRVR